MSGVCEGNRFCALESCPIYDNFSADTLPFMASVIDKPFSYPKNESCCSREQVDLLVKLTEESDILGYVQ